QRILEICRGRVPGRSLLELSDRTNDYENWLAANMALVNRAVAWRDDVRRTIGKDAALIVEQIIGGQPNLKVATSNGGREWRVSDAIRSAVPAVSGGYRIPLGANRLANGKAAILSSRFQARF